MKKLIIILSIIFAIGTTANAQIFIIENETGSLRTPTEVDVFTHPIGHGEGNDYYDPLPDGVLLLAALGGTYLVGKRRKKE